ncbi:MAG TPA: hypothetical protein VFR94_24590 [Nitrososphaeraceae archaeon]|nr:hypothetical protein [Nitrososphaeraceae archaeon]
MVARRREKMTDHKIGTRDEWLAARLELLKAEKALLGVYRWLDRAPKGRNETGLWIGDTTSTDGILITMIIFFDECLPKNRIKFATFADLKVIMNVPWYATQRRTSASLFGCMIMT